MPGTLVLRRLVSEHRERVEPRSTNVSRDSALFGSLRRDFAHRELDLSDVGVGVVLGDGDGGALCSLDCHAAGRARPPLQLLSFVIVLGLRRIRRSIRRRRIRRHSRLGCGILRCGMRVRASVREAGRGKSERRSHHGGGDCFGWDGAGKTRFPVRGPSLVKACVRAAVRCHRGAFG